MIFDDALGYIMMKILENRWMQCGAELDHEKCSQMVGGKKTAHFYTLSSLLLIKLFMKVRKYMNNTSSQIIL